jgi:hypothetical protein
MTRLFPTAFRVGSQEAWRRRRHRGETIENEEEDASDLLVKHPNKTFCNIRLTTDETLETCV